MMDNDSLVVPALMLIVSRKDHKDVSVYTDYNGHFEFDVWPGDFEIIVAGLPKEKFHVYLKIVDTGVNPQDLLLLVDTKSLCKLDPTAPRLLKSEIPPYPPAARAVRASGDVSLQLHVSKDGEVTAAKAVSGHPLLRLPSEAAARKLHFERSEAEDRVTTFTFRYGDFGILNPKVRRFYCPSQILVSNPPDIITTTNAQAR